MNTKSPLLDAFAKYNREQEERAAAIKRAQPHGPQSPLMMRQAHGARPKPSADPEDVAYVPEWAEDLGGE